MGSKFGGSLMRVKFFLILFSFLIAKDANTSETLSTNNLTVLENLIEDADEHTLILWDVDHTLITPDDPILKPKWENLLDEWLGGGKSIVEASGKTRYVFREILMSAPHSVVDQGSLALMEKIKQKQIPMIAFSAAPGAKVGKVESFIDWRIDELKRFGFDFSGSFSDIQPFTLPKDPELEFSPVYKSGVLITSLHDKGSVLLNFLHEIQWKGKKIIFIDDQFSNIQSVVQSLEALNIEVIGIHYTAARDLPCELNEEESFSKLSHFLKSGEWL